MNRAIFLAAAFALAPLPALCQEERATAPQMEEGRGAEPPAAQGAGDRTGDLLDRLARSQLRERMAAAVEIVGDACANDVAEICGALEPGQGRIASCLREQRDLLSRRCRLSLFIVSRRIKQAVSNLADECRTSLRDQCPQGKIEECIEQRSDAISPACRTLVQATLHRGEELLKMKGMSVVSADGKDVGRVVDVERGPDGRIQSAQVQIGRALGISDRVVTLSADQLQELGNQIRLKLGAEQIRTLPETRMPG